MEEQLAAESVRDADALVLRADADEQLAAAARMRIRSEGLPRIEPDARASAELLPDEHLVAAWPSVLVERHNPGTRIDHLGGPLYLTTSRLLLLGRAPLRITLTEIDELAVAGERLLVTLTTGIGLSVQTREPRLMRVTIAAARELGPA